MAFEVSSVLFLIVVDDCTRECPALIPDTSISITGSLASEQAAGRLVALALHHQGKHVDLPLGQSQVGGRQRRTVGGGAVRCGRRRRRRGSTLPEGVDSFFSTGHCALILAPHMYINGLAMTCPSAAQKRRRAEVSARSHLAAPVPSAGTIQFENQSWLLLRVPSAPAYRHALNPSCART
jgi:hypothetical protein